VGVLLQKCLAFALKLCKRKQPCIKRKFIQKLDKILKEEQNQKFVNYFNLNFYSSSSIYSFKNEIHSSCFNMREKINKHNTSGVKRELPSTSTPRSALRERQRSVSAASSRATFYVRMRTTVKHHAAGTDTKIFVSFS
jgi:hypothetical protein